MEIVRETVIDAALEQVFAFVADARNDVAWCPKVQAVELIRGEAPGPGALYRVRHRPIPLRPPREMSYECTDWAPPHRIEWREEDGSDVISVTYRLEPSGGGTSLVQRDDAALGTPRVLHPIMRLGIGRDLSRQLRLLKAVLESDG